MPAAVENFIKELLGTGAHTKRKGHHARVVQRNDGLRRTKLRLEPGDDCTEDGYHAERCDLHDGVDVDVLQLAKRGKERYARVRTLRCASGWIKTEYLVTRAAYERTV